MLLRLSYSYSTDNVSFSHKEVYYFKHRRHASTIEHDSDSGGDGDSYGYRNRDRD